MGPESPCGLVFLSVLRWRSADTGRDPSSTATHRERARQTRRFTAHSRLLGFCFQEARSGRNAKGGRPMNFRTLVGHCACGKTTKELRPEITGLFSMKGWLRGDLNYRPLGYEPSTLSLIWRNSIPILDLGAEHGGLRLCCVPGIKRGAPAPPPFNRTADSGLSLLILIADYTDSPGLGLPEVDPAILLLPKLRAAFLGRPG